MASKETATGELRAPGRADSRLGLYKRLWQREKQWTNGQVQSLVVLSGHKNYVTSLHLAGETLISGSYDDTYAANLLIIS